MKKKMVLLNKKFDKFFNNIKKLVKLKYYKVFKSNKDYIDLVNRLNFPFNYEEIKKIIEFDLKRDLKRIDNYKPLDLSLSAKQGNKFKRYQAPCFYEPDLIESHNIKVADSGKVTPTLKDVISYDKYKCDEKLKNIEKMFNNKLETKPNLNLKKL